MAGFMLSAVTTRGLALLAATQAGQKLTFTRIDVGDGYPTGNIKDMVALNHPVRSYGIEGYSVQENDFMAWTTVGSEGNATGYYLREQGLFAADPSFPDDREKDILYAVSVVEPEDEEDEKDYFVFVPPTGSSSVVAWRLEIHTIVASSSEITVIIGAPTDYATLADLEAYTPLFMFIPSQKDGRWYGGHGHVMSDIDGLQEAMDDWERRFLLLTEMVNNGVSGGTEFRMTFWSLTDVIVTDGQWVPQSGLMRA